MADLTPGKPLPNVPELTVSELAGAIKRALEDGFGHVRLRGEVSGYRGPHSSGHCYFALKDDKARIDAVIWRGVWGKLKVKPEEGMEVVVTGKVSSFPGSSKYQIVIEALEPAGAGALMALLEERKRKLAAEGLFAPERKRPLPFLPRVVGIVTSPTGAVIRDMLHGFAERFPTHVVVWPVRVQGETSAAEVAAAIRGFNALPRAGPIARPDVLIVARGGGSLEDLWGFNEEIVVRAAAESAIPLISAVGHETDWTLIDLVADARAPTPTKAAEWAVPKYSDLIQQMGDQATRLTAGMRRAIEHRRTELKAASRGLPRLEDILALPRQRYDAVEKRLGRALGANTRSHALRFVRVASRLRPGAIGERLVRARQRVADTWNRAGPSLLANTRAHALRVAKASSGLRPTALADRIARASERADGLADRARQALANRVVQRRRLLDGHAMLLRSLGYQSVLARGYAVVRGHDGVMLREAAGIAAGDALEIEFHDGRIAAEARGGPRPGGEESETGHPRDARLPSPGKGQRRPGRAKGPDQGSLF